MAFTVGEVAKIARVSVRTLHHYDHIGLVEPTDRSAAGYRLYTESDLDRLQTVLLYRQLGFRLEDIAAILADPRFDRRAALSAQRAVLAQNVERARAMLELVDRTLRALDGGAAMTPEEKFEAFGGFDPEAHAEEAKARWGQTESYRESAKRTARYTKDDWKRIRAEDAALLDELAAAAQRGVAPDDPVACALAERHRLAIDRSYYPCPHATHAALGRMYVDDPRFAAVYEARRAGLAVYLRDAILANAARHGVSG